MNTTHALRHLVGVLHRMDLPDEQKRPTEHEYLLAMASADRALADLDAVRQAPDLLLSPSPIHRAS